MKEYTVPCPTCSDQVFILHVSAVCFCYSCKWRGGGECRTGGRSHGACPPRWNIEWLLFPKSMAADGQTRKSRLSLTGRSSKLYCRNAKGRLSGVFFLSHGACRMAGCDGPCDEIELCIQMKTRRLYNPKQEKVGSRKEAPVATSYCSSDTGPNAEALCLLTVRTRLASIQYSQEAPPLPPEGKKETAAGGGKARDRHFSLFRCSFCSALR